MFAWLGVINFITVTINGTKLLEDQSSVHVHSQFSPISVTPSIFPFLLGRRHSVTAELPTA